MKSGEIWYNISKRSVGVRIEEYSRRDKLCLIQHVDFIDGRPTRSFIFENALESKIKKMYAKSSYKKS
jgi:hypothetical protein